MNGTDTADYFFGLSGISIFIEQHEVSMFAIIVYCPNCDQRLEVEEERHNYVILDNGHSVTVCPGCLRPLMYEGGELKVEERNV